MSGGLKTADILPFRQKIFARLGIAPGGRMADCYRCRYIAQCRELERDGLEVLCELSDDEIGIPERPVADDYWLRETHQDLRPSVDVLFGHDNLDAIIAKEKRMPRGNKPRRGKAPPSVNKRHYR